MKIIPLSEGSFTIDKSKYFIPFDEQADNLHERAKGSLLVEIQPFVIITSNDIILIDTGLGFEKDDRLQLHLNLMNAGINPADVTKVLVSHLHKDHAGAICMDREMVRSGLSLPKATYFIQQAELDIALETGFPSYRTEELACLVMKKEQVKILNGNGFIEKYIEYEITGAHAPYHQVFWIREEEQIIFFGGDEAPQLQQMKHRFIAKYDYDGKKAMELRQKWWRQGEKEKWTFLFYHDVKNPVWKF